MNIHKLMENLEKRGFTTTHFAAKEEAVSYLQSQISGKTVAFGGSMTLKEMGLDKALAENNDGHLALERARTGDAFKGQGGRSVSVQRNAVAETGELVNIDGTGNRLAALCFGPKQVLVLCSAGKIQPTTETAVSRARNTAAPANALRFGGKTPCAADGLCHNCLSPDCICNQILLARACRPAGRIHVFLIGEELGL